MNRMLFGASVLFLIGAWIGSRTVVATAKRPPARSAPPAPQVVEAARALLDSLDPEKKEKCTFSFDDKERFNWHFVPRSRKGVALKEMSPDERQRLTALLQASLSEVGVRTVKEVRELEAILAEIEGPGRSLVRDPELYCLSVFGKPAAGSRWGWRFEGHHLSLNFTLEGDKMVSATPLFLGANPAVIPSGPKKGKKTLAGVEDVARELMESLDERQRAQALGTGEPEEVKGTGSARYEGPLPAGLSASDLSGPQRKIFRRLLRHYVKHLRADVRGPLLKEIRESGMDKVQIVWRGSVKPFEGHSYLIHGPSFVVSYANFQNGARHVHSAFRGTTAEFGLGSG